MSIGEHIRFPSVAKPCPPTSRPHSWI